MSGCLTVDDEEVVGHVHVVQIGAPLVGLGQVDFVAESWC